MKYKLEDICIKITDGSHFSPKDNKNSVIPMYSVKDMREFNFDMYNCKHISEEDYIKLLAQDCVPKKNDILVAKDGSYLKEIFVNEIEDKKAILSSIAIFRPNLNIVNPYFLCYLLKSPEISNYTKENCVSGSAIPRIVLKDFKKIELDIPEICIQNKIVKILKKINEKIIANTHTNNNLYEIGKALYQEYFENEEYTNNYEIRQLREVTTNNRNKINQTKEYKVLSAVNTGNLVLSDDYFDKQVYSKDIGKYLNVNKNDFAYNPARINIGSIGLNTFDFNCCVSPVYVTFSVDKDYIDFFDFYFKSKRFNAEVTLRASGSVRQALNYNDFGMIEIPYPTKEMIEKFNSSYKKIKERININKTKISNLEQLRDTLLPKLMNGEIDLDKIEI